MLALYEGSIMGIVHMIVVDVRLTIVHKLFMAVPISTLVASIVAKF
jgi:hypothetical protein